ncbi:hypothetical protein GCM10022631_22950 [Deinococcus rubellus]|uniref:hypothetical protein n=1 Tax=Deinococcus rubellus TaxID=1889240 RepID=UPI0031F162DF
MKLKQRSGLQALFGGAALMFLLTACPGPIPPPPIYNPQYLTFKYPALPSTVNSRNTYLAAIAIDTSGSSNTVTVVNSVALDSGSLYASPQPNTAQLPLYNLDSLLNGKSQCLQDVVKGEADGIKDFKVTPEKAQTCNVYFVIYEDRDGNSSPSSAEELYSTHDIMSYASSDLTYSYTSEDGNSAVSGVRSKGWSLVRHLALQPVSTPGKYLVSMNSVPKEDKALALTMHEPSAFYTSQSLPSAAVRGSQP